MSVVISSASPTTSRSACRKRISHPRGNRSLFARLALIPRRNGFLQQHSRHRGHASLFEHDQPFDCQPLFSDFPTRSVRSVTLPPSISPRRDCLAV